MKTKIQISTDDAYWCLNEHYKHGDITLIVYKNSKKVLNYINLNVFDVYCSNGIITLEVNTESDTIFKIEISDYRIFWSDGSLIRWYNLDLDKMDNNNLSEIKKSLYNLLPKNYLRKLKLKRIKNG